MKTLKAFPVFILITMSSAVMSFVPCLGQIILGLILSAAVDYKNDSNIKNSFVWVGLLLSSSVLGTILMSVIILRDHPVSVALSLVCLLGTFFANLLLQRKKATTQS